MTVRNPPRWLVVPCTLAILLLGGAAPAPPVRAQAAGGGGPAMTMADIIGMTTFGGQRLGYAQPIDIDVASPDGRLHAVLVKRGDVAKNTNVFSLLLFRTDQLFTRPRPDTLLTLVSASNRPAIGSVRWLSDNHTLAFLGEHPGELPQVYTIDIGTRVLTPRTHHPTEILSYDIALSGNPVVYTARPAVDTSGYPAMRRRGFAIRPTQFVGDVLTGAWTAAASDWVSGANPQLLISHAGAPAPLVVPLPGPIYRFCEPSLSIAPTGQVALVWCTRPRAPPLWTAYTDPYVANLLVGGATLAELALLDLEQGTLAPLVDAPAINPSARWSPTGTSVVIANAFLPLDGLDSTERRARVAKPGIAEIDVRTRRLTVIAHRDSLDVVGWDSASNTVEFVPGFYGTGSPEGPRTHYRRTAHGWVEVKPGTARVKAVPELIVEEGFNQRPHLVAVDRGNKRRATVLDPNPQLAQLRLGRVEIVHWRTRSGQARTGGLYYPPTFARGQSYPLVIQTHGFDSTAFQPDGFYPTGNAAQPMAAAGMLVLQLGVGDIADESGDSGTPDEAPHAMEEIEGAIDHLDSLALIDRSRVGLIGFSRTCFHVLYTLTHSRYPIAAAALTDGVDFSYLQYLLFQNAQAGVGNTLDEDTAINGGLPWGKTQQVWRDRAPGFTLDRVTAPLRLEAIGLPSVLGEWEPYAGLLLQGKPVELFVLPEGDHLLVKPWERLASSEGNADWFRFWLKGEEDPDPARAEQYARWRELRRLQVTPSGADTVPRSRPTVPIPPPGP